MRLSEWRTRGKSRDATAAKVWATVDPILAGLGSDPDPHGWVAWGDDPNIRFSVYVPTAAGMISCFVRVNIPGEGPRANAKLIRWNRIQIGELTLETQAGHRLLTFQLEGQVIRGVDVEADLGAAFALDLFAAMDGRPTPTTARGRRRGPAAKRTSANAPSAKAQSAARPAPAKRPAATENPRPAAVDRLRADRRQPESSR